MPRVSLREWSKGRKAALTLEAELPWLQVLRPCPIQTVSQWEAARAAGRLSPRGPNLATTTSVGSVLTVVESTTAGVAEDAEIVNMMVTGPCMGLSARGTSTMPLTSLRR